MRARHQRTTTAPARTAIATLSLALAASGCSKPEASPELRTARDAYTEAESGVASELAPAELDRARQALERAEQAFSQDHKSPKVADLSYIAERTSQLATAYGTIEAEKREAEDLEEKLEKLEKKFASMTRDELEEARMALAAKKREVERQKEDLNKTEQQLAQERALRKQTEQQLAAALTSLDKVGQIKEEARGVVITLSGAVLFATGQHELLPIAKEKLNEVAKALKDQGYKEIVVEGHTDSRGSDSTNEALSRDRARSVRDHLISQGIESDKISAKGLGESRPVADNDTPEGRANNRRVELVVIPE